MTDPTFAKWASEGLIWLPEKGMGYYPVKESPYDQSYWDKYVEYAKTSMGSAITDARALLVDKYIPWDDIVVDVGIGCGSFIERRGQLQRGGFTFGWDICPTGVEWLNQRELLWNPYTRSTPNICFWDAIEHIPDIDSMLDGVERYVFVTVPIFQDGAHILRSRHFRPTEHCWYWTRDGFIAWMREKGFICMEHNTMESLLGREDSHTFVFKRW
jgi:hypothetical protein